MAAREQVDILLVEDNQYDEKLTLRALRKHHLANHIHVVRDGAEALDFVFARAAYAGRYVDLPAKVILLDIKLPKVDGLEVLRQIREDPRTARQPVVMLTSSGEKQDIDLAYEYGANSYIVKPVEFQGFVAAVRDLGLYWLLLNQPPEPADLAASRGNDA